MKNTKNSYTKHSYNASVPDNKGAQQPSKDHAWLEFEGDSHEVLKGFPREPRGNLGHYLRLLQAGERPQGCGAVPGLEDVFELRDQDERAWYRVLYLKRIGDVIHVLHCFEKKTNQIEKKDIRTARSRLAAVHGRLIKEKRHAAKTEGAARNKGQHTR